MTRQSVSLFRRFPQFNLELLGHVKCAKPRKKNKEFHYLRY